MKPKQILTQSLIVEKTGNEFWGRIKVNNNLIVDSAHSVESLRNKLKNAAFEIENAKIEDFDVSYA